MGKDQKIAVVTGANSGVGFEVAKGLVKRDYQVVMACRSLDKADSAKAQIQDELPSASIEVMQVDMSDSASVTAFAEQFKSKFSHLNLLINNAGILLNKPQRNNDNIELQFATNHLGHFLLTSLLLDLMPDTAESRVVSLSSIAHKGARIHFDDINCDKTSKWDVPYGQSKLACLMFADELQRRLTAAGKNVLSVAAHPGGTDTGLFDSLPQVLVRAIRLSFVPLFLHSNESAARPVLKAALEQGVKGGDYYGPTGLFEMKGPPGKAKRSGYSKKQDVAAQLWDLSEQLIGETFKIEAV